MDKRSKTFFKKEKSSLAKELIFTPEEKKQLADFFSLLIKIDQRENITEIYDKPNK